MMGCGKTTVARGIAKEFDVPYVDTDRIVEDGEGLTVAEIFSAFGEPYFRSREAEAIRQCLEGGPSSIATGGGTYLNVDSRKLINRLAISFWLEANVDVIWNRVKQKPTRPLLATANPYETIVGLLRKRTPVYRLAHIRICSEDTALKSETVRKAVRALIEADSELGIFHHENHDNDTTG